MILQRYELLNSDFNFYASKSYVLWFYLEFPERSVSFLLHLPSLFDAIEITYETEFLTRTANIRTKICGD